MSDAKTTIDIPVPHCPMCRMLLVEIKRLKTALEVAGVAYKLPDHIRAALKP